LHLALKETIVTRLKFNTIARIGIRTDRTLINGDSEIEKLSHRSHGSRNTDEIPIFPQRIHIFARFTSDSYSNYDSISIRSLSFVCAVSSISETFWSVEIVKKTLKYTSHKFKLIRRMRIAWFQLERVREGTAKE